jgi:hypothetical protein
MKKDLVPARETKLNMPEKSSDDSPEIFAVCLETDDRELLIPFKIYRVKLRGEYALVTDEAGDAAVYPNSFFLPLQLPPETANVLSSAFIQVS